MNFVTRSEANLHRKVRSAVSYPCGRFSPASFYGENCSTRSIRFDGDRPITIIAAPCYEEIESPKEPTAVLNAAVKCRIEHRINAHPEDAVSSRKLPLQPQHLRTSRGYEGGLHLDSVIVPVVLELSPQEDPFSEVSRHAVSKTGRDPRRTSIRGNADSCQQGHCTAIR